MVNKQSRIGPIKNNMWMAYGKVSRKKVDTNFLFVVFRGIVECVPQCVGLVKR